MLPDVDRTNQAVFRGFDAESIENSARGMCVHAWVGSCGTDITDSYRNGERAGPCEVWRDFIPDAQQVLYGVEPAIDFYGTSDVPQELD